jgi:5-formyltetrahydrofolate cyclo-ligase
MNKDEARLAARSALRAVRAAVSQEAAISVERSVWEIPEIAGAQTLLIYSALPQEVPTDGIADAARQRGIQVVYPRCLDAGELALHSVRSADQLLRAGRFGILEPGLDCPIVSTGEIDAALIPGLAWSRAGHRLGRGAGYYDRLLASPGWRGFRCGLFLAAQELPDLPADPWDEPLDAVLTENGVTRF